MKGMKKSPAMSHSQALMLTLLAILFQEVIVTKAVVLIWPETDPWANASDINKVFIAALIPLLILLYLKTPLVVNWSALKLPARKNFGREMLEAACVSAVLIIGMLGIRIWMNAHDASAAARPWFGLYLDIHGRWFYPWNVILQEMMIKAFVQENIRIANGKGSRHLPVLLTGLFFAALHMNYQLYYLIGAGLLCMLTGYMYERDGNIWGAALIHLTLGFMPRALGLY